MADLPPGAMRAIDTRHGGRPHAICCWQVGEVLIDPGPTSSVENVLAALDGWRPRAILLTHIHFDHAGATGALARIWPDVQVYVHERGAPHMVNPERLWASASRLYGEENMLALWGRFEPVPLDRLVSLRGGETLRIGPDRFEVAYTPGHAQHHVCYLHEGMAFVGDVAGVRIEPAAPTIPPTPPPDIDIEAWHRSIELLAAWRPERLGITHFGLSETPERQLQELSARLDTWAAAARGQDRDAWIRDVAADLRAVTSADTFETFMHATPLDQCYAGLRRYWDGRAEATSTQ
ncbi:MAG: MBL fold metallo-hydrolase [Solirubrobacteraceae bacterium]